MSIYYYLLYFDSLFMTVIIELCLYIQARWEGGHPEGAPYWSRDHHSERGPPEGVDAGGSPPVYGQGCTESLQEVHKGWGRRLPSRW